MITFIAFILTIAGCVNWLMIGLLQYDFIAGWFGFQASIFSRLIYILFGVASAYLIIRVIANKGTFKVFERRKKKEAEIAPQPAPATANIEAASEQLPKDSPKKKKKWWQFWKKKEKKKVSKEDSQPKSVEVNIQNTAPSQPVQTQSQERAQDNLFDEHFKAK